MALQHINLHIQSSYPGADAEAHAGEEEDEADRLLALQHMDHLWLHDPDCLDCSLDSRKLTRRLLDLESFKYTAL